MRASSCSECAAIGHHLGNLCVVNDATLVSAVLNPDNSLVVLVWLIDALKGL